jgi:apolipoprotein N-acyltransferase
MRRRLGIILLCLLTVVLLTICFAPFDQWYLAYVALVPWLTALGAPTSRREAVLWGTLTGTVFWAANLYWLCWITLVGYAALVVYLSAYWLAASLLLRSARRRDWPMWIVLPVVWVALEYVRAHGLSGFPWFFLAHSQYRQVRLIQVADVTGVYGVSFLVAMVNGAVADLLAWAPFVPGRAIRRLRRRAVAGAAASVLAAGGLLGYGTWRLSQDTRRPGPVVALVQEAFPVSLHQHKDSEGMILRSYLDLAQQLRSEVQGRLNLVGLPESTMPAGANAEFLSLDPNRFPGIEDRQREVRRLLAGGAGGETGDRKPEQSVAALSASLGCPILAGGTTVHRNARPLGPWDRWLFKNSVLCFDGSADSPTVYSKVHLVPFSEYVPFKHDWLWLHRALRRFVPAVMVQLTPGERFTTLALSGAGPAGRSQTWRLAMPICYEGTFARVCRRMVYRGGRKRADVLVNLSNDGWFVWRGRASTEHAQHLAHYCFRAVENRVPVLRAVNTGITASIDSAGRRVAVLRRHGRATMVNGVLLLDGRRAADPEQAVQHGPVVLVDRRRSLYSLVGDAFAMVVSLLGAGLAVWVIVRRAPASKEPAIEAT